VPVTSVDRLADTPATARGRLAKLWRFGAVSAMSIVLTQSLLQAAYLGTDVGAVGANIFAVGVSSVPAYLANRRWVWRRQGPHSLAREIIPFWGYSFAGLVLSTVAVAAVHDRWESALAVSVANLAAFAVLWASKFVFLDAWMFSERNPVRDRPPAGGPTA
jgi:putative flippase GtrA